MLPVTCIFEHNVLAVTILKALVSNVIVVTNVTVPTNMLISVALSLRAVLTEVARQPILDAAAESF